jgi:hypothetical protein
VMFKAQYRKKYTLTRHKPFCQQNGLWLHKTCSTALKQTQLSLMSSLDGSKGWIIEHGHVCECMSTWTSVLLGTSLAPPNLMASGKMACTRRFNWDEEQSFLACSCLELTTLLTELVHYNHSDQ